jgi:SAM-dependent methyltransferase
VSPRSTEVPDFSGLAKSYSESRPGYPPELFAWLASVAPGHGLAWDVATGNGQAAVGLAGHFERVVATDVSAEQLCHAQVHPRVEYRVGPAEASDLPAGSVDVVVAAAAVHWFDLPRFYEEIRRVARPGAVAAIWSYHVARVSEPLGEVLWSFYRDVVAPYFAAGASLVDDRYEAIELPGTELCPPPFESSVSWTVEQVVAFVRTWSGVEAYLRATGEDPVVALEPQLEAAFGSRGVEREVAFPLHLRASKLSMAAER